MRKGKCGLIHQQKAIRNYAMARLMLDAGLRVGEVVGQTYGDLFWSNEPVKSIFISAELSKTGKGRMIPVAGTLCLALTALRSSYEVKENGIDKDYAFFNKDSMKPLSVRSVEYIIKIASFKALGFCIHPHILRHTFASRLMRITDMRTVQELLGHKHLSSTEIYTHPNANDLKSAIDNASLIQL